MVYNPGDNMYGNSKEAAMGYVGGIIDGEGAIFITHDYFQHKSPVHRIEIRIGMIHKEAVDFLVTTLNVGKVFLEKSYANKRPMYRLVYQNRDDIRNVLDQVYPYLLVKKSQADIAYEFLDKALGQRGRWLSEEKKEIRKNLYIRMRELNGIAAPATTERNGKRGRSRSVRLEATV